MSPPARCHAGLSQARQGRFSAIAQRRLEGELELRRLFHSGGWRNLPGPIEVQHFNDCEYAAAAVRMRWDLGDRPIDGLPELIAERGGTVVGRQRERRFDGLSGWAGRHPLFVLHTAVPLDRLRFNAAHELGRLVMESAGEGKTDEQFAIRFAAALLVPAEAVRRELGTHRRRRGLDELGLLKRRWGPEPARTGPPCVRSGDQWSGPRPCPLAAAATPASWLLGRVTAAGQPRLTLSDRGLACLGRRWSARPRRPAEPLGWRNVAGSRSRQLLRHLAHTEAAHWFNARLAAQAAALGLERVQLDPPHRASRYFRLDGRIRSVHPDAYAQLRAGAEQRGCFLEWERRAVRPGTMAAKLAPYRRYFASRRPLEDHGLRPSVLVVFEDRLLADHFLRVAERELAQARIALPLLVSDRPALEAAGPLGPAWRSLGRRSPQQLYAAR